MAVCSWSKESGTPTLFVNSRRHRGSYEAQALVDALHAAAAHGRR